MPPVYALPRQNLVGMVLILTNWVLPQSGLLAKSRAWTRKPYRSRAAFPY